MTTRSEIPEVAGQVLDAGTFCTVAVPTVRGPHATPLVFAWYRDAVWVTTARGSIKARAWARDPRVAGLVRSDRVSVAFTGSVRTYDALDTATWGTSVLDAPTLARATARFSRKNARFFAGYAIDARKVPLAWTPPGRVFGRLQLDGGAVLDDLGPVAVWGSWATEHGPRPTMDRYRSLPASGAVDSLAGLPEKLGRRLDRGGDDAALALATSGGPVVLPARWAADDRELWAALPSQTRALGGAPPRGSAALSIDRASWWRARDMAGAMAQGEAETFALDRLSSGATAAAKKVRATGLDPSDASLVRLTSDRLVWWQGWSSGTVRP
ncbi:MAG: hypothetical protein WEA10_09935 [Actinomycetota bacterium]